MARSTLTSKWQITVPKEIRQRLHITPGDRIDFVVEEDGQIVVRPARSRLRQLRGMLRDRKRKPVSVDQMDAAISRQHARRSCAISTASSPANMRKVRSTREGNPQDL